MSVSIPSIQDQLRNVAKSAELDFQLILTRYFQERTLYRVAKSAHRDNFCLKGGLLLYAYEREASRPTLDLDLLSMKIKMDKTRFNAIFKEICSISGLDDGLQFHIESIVVSEIMEQRRYSGLQIKVPVSLGNMRQLIKIDIGFGDIVTPAPLVMTYPTLLEMEAPEIQAYSIETVIAEKFEAMIDLAESNSRMKDFYDVYQLIKNKRFDSEILKTAIIQTFRNRQTVLRAEHPLFDSAFAENLARQQLWNNFLNRTKLDVSVSFTEVMREIRACLGQLLFNG